MGSSQKYSLKWNDFTVNVASTFRDLHSRHDFVDVTLACSDGSTLEAHKVILSSVSSYFRDILKVFLNVHYHINRKFFQNYSIKHFDENDLLFYILFNLDKSL